MCSSLHQFSKMARERKGQAGRRRHTLPLPPPAALRADLRRTSWREAQLLHDILQSKAPWRPLREAPPHGRLRRIGHRKGRSSSAVPT